MKTAIYIEEGVVQLVITPENDFEKNALRSFDGDSGVDAEIFSGGFYDCRGGWVRQNSYYRSGYGASERDTNERSLIIRAAPESRTLRGE